MYQPKISLKDFLGGTEIRFESIHNPIYHNCRYKVNGRWIMAKICLDTGVIIIRGQVVRRCNLC